MDVSFIQKQLDMGEPIEHEHTQDHDLAKDIALQHLDEFPDYYTRLKKMEADAKKHHKKFKDVKEQCGCEENAVQELEDGLKRLNDISYSSIDKLMRRIMKKHHMTAKQLHNAFKNTHNEVPDEWIRNLKEETKSGDEGLRDWFSKSKSSDGKSGWVQLGGKWAGKPCARQEGQTSTPKCGSSKMAANLSPEEEEKARRRKNIQDPNQPQKTGASKPTNVRTEDMELHEVKDKPGKGSGKKDACYHKVKSRYDVWPSAYASGALVKCRKVGAANWGTQSEEMEMLRYCPKCQKDEKRSECKYGPKYWDMFSIPSSLSSNQMKFSIAQVHPANESKEPDHEYSMARSELSTIISAAKRLRGKLKGEGNIEAWVQSKITKAADYIDAAADYLDSGEHNVQGSMDEGLSFEIGHTSTDARKAIRQDKILKRAASGQQGADIAKKKFTGIQLPLADSTNLKTFGQFMQEAIDKSKMKCNSPKSDPVGDSLTGKSHVVKACEDGEEKLIRFGQRGVKGSPKKKGESKEYASRRRRFQSRHSKNIAKGKMSAAYWANKVKW